MAKHLILQLHHLHLPALLLPRYLYHMMILIKLNIKQAKINKIKKIHKIRMETNRNDKEKKRMKIQITPVKIMQIIIKKMRH